MTRMVPLYLEVKSMSKKNKKNKTMATVLIVILIISMIAPIILSNLLLAMGG